ncbi:energy-coupling factor transporter transmembrane protein EcfT [Candidatus Bipolaricaulota bacterium]|nr:energy-coupling factor transporter transmembrane protein EcfT [Candidatus Bipolaricaulota bacterium]
MTTQTLARIPRGLRNASPGSGLLLLLVLVTAVLATPSIILRAVALLLVLAATAWSRVEVGGFLKSLRFVVVFAVVLFIAQALSVKTGAPLVRVPILITADGIQFGLAMALRFLVILTASFLFVQVIDPDRLAASVIRWGIPYRYGYLLILSLRFVPFFQRELKIVREAQRLRGIQPSLRSLSGIRTVARYTFVPVLVSGLMRVESIAMSMKGRCFGLHPQRTPGAANGITRADVTAWMLAAGLAAAAALSTVGTWP